LEGRFHNPKKQIFAYGNFPGALKNGFCLAQFVHRHVNVTIIQEKTELAGVSNRVMLNDFLNMN
jgi:hypothetical protein